MKLGTVGRLIVPPADVDPNVGRIDMAAEMGLSVISVNFREPGQDDPGYMAKVAEAAAKKGIELRTGNGGRFGSADPEERKADVDRLVELLLRVNKHAGIKFSSLANQPMSHNRWAPNPPMNERVGIIAENLATVADAVASSGMVLGLENHCDYRGYECAAMLEMANRPNLKAQLDTGNAFTVFEEPVVCAMAVAKWVVSVHLKDIIVTPLAPAPWRCSKAETAPLGAGQVDNYTICKILRAEAPDPMNIALMVEPLAMPEESARPEFLATSIAWARKALAEFLD